MTHLDGMCIGQFSLEPLKLKQMSREAFLSLSKLKFLVVKDPF